MWDEYWYSGDIYETEADASAAGKALDQEEYIWAVDPVTVHLQGNKSHGQELTQPNYSKDSKEVAV